MKIRVTINRKINDVWYKSSTNFDSWDEANKFMSSFEPQNKYVKFEVLLIRADA